MTMVKGGVAYNVIPSEMDISFDLRIPPTVNLQVCYPELLLSAHHGCCCCCSLACFSSTLCKLILRLKLNLCSLVNYCNPTRSLNDRSKPGAMKQVKMSLMNLLRSVLPHFQMSRSCETSHYNSSQPLQKHMNQNTTSTAETDPWWRAFSGACREMWVCGDNSHWIAEWVFVSMVFHTSAANVHSVKNNPS